MTAIPEKQNTTLAAIDKALEESQDCAFRDHLGASLIGDECSRRLWYTFRWAKIPGFTARIIRLFARGNREEDVFIDLLKAANCNIWSVDPKTGEQFRVSWFGGHFGGSFDGIGKRLVEASKSAHVLEFKTHNDKSFRNLQNKGVKESKPKHWAQMQIYMHGSQQLGGKLIDRAYYMAVNKNDDQLYGERVKYDKAAAESYLEKASNIIKMDVPPARISDRPNWYICLQCDYRHLCHYDQIAFPSCRSCVHATPEIEVGGWNCIHSLRTLDHADQMEACNDHLYIPELIPYGDLLDSDGKTYALYIKGDQKFANIVGGMEKRPKVPAYLSSELFSIDPKLIGNKELEELRTNFDAKVVK